MIINIVYLFANYCIVNLTVGIMTMTIATTSKKRASRAMPNASVIASSQREFWIYWWYGGEARRVREEIFVWLLFWFLNFASINMNPYNLPLQQKYRTLLRNTFIFIWFLYCLLFIQQV